MNFDQSNTEKTQQQLREQLEQKLYSLKPTILAKREEYKKALKDGDFDDEEGKEKQQQRQRDIMAIVERAKGMKKKLDSGEELKENEPVITTTYTNPEGKTESIEIDLDKRLQDFISFYNQLDIDLPDDFEDKVKEIWKNHFDQIQKEIEQYGFDSILIIPPTTDIVELKDKMAMENGYWESFNFQNNGGFGAVQSPNTDKIRIVLTYNTKELIDRPELNKTLDTKQTDYNRAELMTLQDYIIFQRKYFAENQSHADIEKYTWTSSRVGLLAVSSGWNSDDSGLDVGALDPEDQDGDLGARSARYFF